ncbi:MAG: TonB-dependent receptor [Calditrichaeota bacterium]|nr:MAG: TonB-dependent receptor [Calditrichota bacterium]
MPKYIFKFFPLIFILYNPALFASNLETFSGRIINAKTNEALPGANIQISPGNRGTAANNQGIFIIELAHGSYRVKVTCIGYKAHTLSITLPAKSSVPVAIAMEPEAILFDAVEIAADKDRFQKLSVEQIDVTQIRTDDILSLPGAFDDPIRAAQIYSGTGGASDFTSFLTTRGSSPAQNQVVMDGISVPNPYRMRIAMGGGLSLFNPKTIENVNLHMGGYSAQFGNALASILEVNTRAGNKHKRSYGFSLNLTDLNSSAEGPLPEKWGSYLFSFRRTYFDLLASGFATDGSVLPFSQEFSGKLVFNLSPTTRFTANFLKSNEEMNLLAGTNNPADFNSSENAGLALYNFSLQSILWKRWLFETRLAYYKDETRFHTYRSNADAEEFAVQDVFANNNRWHLKQKVNLEINQTYWLQAGSSIIKDKTISDFRLRANWIHNARNEYPTFAQYENESWSSESFVEMIAKYGRHTEIRLGMRYDFSAAYNQGQWGPRFNIIQQVFSLFRLKASWGKIYQYPNYMSIYTHEFPLNLDRALDSLTAEVSYQHVAGLETRIARNYKLSFDGYYTRIENMLLPDERNNNLPMNSGKSIARGVELLLEKNGGRIFTGLVSYTTGSSRYRNYDSKIWTRSKYELTRSLTVLANAKINKRWQASLLWRYASGMPYTNFNGTMLRHFNSDLDVLDGRFIFTFANDERNNALFPSYKRLDGRISYSKKIKYGKMLLYLDLINLLNHENLYEIIWSLSNGQGDDSETITAERHELYMLPFLPSFGLSFDF